MQFRFGRFVLDGARFELRASGQKVEVQPKVLRLLLYLAQNSDRVVAVEELLSQLWRGETVSTASVRRAIKSARHALGENAESSATIRTVHGYGYQFIAQPSREAESSPDPGASARSPRPSRKTAAVARAGLLSILEDAWLEAEHARGHALLLVGEEGAGKSAALQQLAAVARRRGGICWIARGAAVEGAPAYWPFVAVLRDALQQSELPWRQLIAYGAGDIAPALPDLMESLGVVSGGAELEAPTARFRFFDSMLGFLRRVTAHAPLLLVIDDLTLADGPTIELFSFLATHAAGSRLLLAAASTPFPRPARASSAELALLFRHTRQVPVLALTAKEIEALIVQRWGGSIEPERVTELIVQTAGNALLLEQLLNLCRPSSAAGAPRWEMLERAAESHAVRSAVERMAGQLSTEARKCFELAALIGRPFSPWLLAELLDRPALEIQTYLEEAHDSGLLQHHGDGSDRSQFRHGIVQQVLARGDDPAHRQALHARAARALEKQHALGEAVPGDVAHHFLCAGEYERGLTFSLRAARLALQQSEGELALHYYDQALAALEHLPSDPWRRADVLLEHAEAQAETCAFAAARSTYLEVGDLARELGCKELLAKSALGLSTPGLREADWRELTLLREAFEQLDADHDGYALVAAAFARGLCLDHDTALRSKALAVAIEAARKVRHPLTRANALVLCHEAMSEREPQHERAALAREAAAIARGQSNPRLLLRAASAQLRDALHVGDIQTVDVSLTMIEQLSKQRNDPFSRWCALLYRSMRDWLDGRVELAMAHAEEALQFGLSVGEPIARHCYFIQVSRCLRLLGESARQREIIYEASMRYPAISGWRCAVALSEVDVGRLDAARSIFRELMTEGLDALSRDAFVLTTLCPLAELCGWVGDAEHAKQLYAALLPYAKHCGTVAFGVTTYGPVSRLLGILAGAYGNYDRALEHLEASARQAAQMGSPTFICLTAATHAYVALELSGRADLLVQGVTELKLAQSLARQHGFAAVERHCRALEGNQSSKHEPTSHTAHST